jgi:hypothetical protein
VIIAIATGYYSSHTFAAFINQSRLYAFIGSGGYMLVLYKDERKFGHAGTQRKKGTEKKKAPLSKNWNFTLHFDLTIRS